MAEKDVKIWPWIIPLPLEDKQHYKVLLSIFSSKISIDILRNIKLNEKTYQSELIRKLPYSNKTILAKLKEFVNSRILEQGLEKQVRGNRSFWVKWYKPSTLGRWVITFLTPPEEMKIEEIKETFRQLFKMYIESIVKFCIQHKINLAEYYQILEEEYISEYLKNLRKIENKVDVTVFGSVALDMIINFDRPPQFDETILAKNIIISAGGSAANVAVGLSRLGVKTAFIGRIGTDEASRIILTKLYEEGVNVSQIKIIREAKLPKTVILAEKGEKRIITIADEKTLSLTSPDEVAWNYIDISKVVYIGEVYVEVASIIASYAKAKGKTVIYRILTPFAEMGLEKLQGIISNTTHIIANEVAWKKLVRKTRKIKLKSPSDLLSLGVNSIIITKGRKGATLYTKNKEIIIPPYEVKAIDSTGAGDAFSAGFIWAILNGYNLEKAAEIANILAAISTTKIGAQNSMPRLKDVMELIYNKLK